MQAVVGVAVLVLCSCAFLLFHSYILFPLILRWLAGSKVLPYKRFSSSDRLPKVFVVFSAFNEAAIIEKKIRSVFQTNYPSHLLDVYVGSDQSTDGTNTIAQQLTDEFSRLHFFAFEKRSGKSGVLNQLIQKIREQHAADCILVLTDANVIFEQKTIAELVAYFADDRVALTGANVLNLIPQQDGIAAQEQFYIQRENSIKYREGLLWGAMQGAFGACYAIRSNCLSEIPTNFLMEDFYISMKTLQMGHKVILNPEARCYEDIPAEVQEEFKRKTRISTGNFQNLSAFRNMLLRFDAVGFCFWSHKVLRWLGPLWLLLMLVALAVLWPFHLIWKVLLIGMLLLIASPWIDGWLKNAGIRFSLLRFASYFISMNAALAVGWWRYVRGVNSGAWNPTKRHV